MLIKVFLHLHGSYELLPEDDAWRIQLSFISGLDFKTASFLSKVHVIYTCDSLTIAQVIVW